MKSLLTLNFMFFFFTCGVFAQKQKVDVKKDVVSVDGIPVFTMVSTTYPDAYTLYNFSKEKLAVFNAQFYSDAQQITPGNPQGRVGYFDVTFFNESMDKCEIRIVGFKKQLAQLIVAEELIKDGKLNDIAVKQFCRVNGMKFSEARKQNTPTIIINNQ